MTSQRRGAEQRGYGEIQGLHLLVHTRLSFPRDDIPVAHPPPLALFFPQTPSNSCPITMYAPIFPSVTSYLW